MQTSVIWAKDTDRTNNMIQSTVHVWDPPVVEIAGGVDTLVSSLPLTLDAGMGFTSYLWQDNSANNTFEVTQEGLYWVAVSSENGCFDRDSVYITTQTGIFEADRPSDQIRIYPNPADEVLNVAFDLDREKEVILELYSISNSLIYRKDLKKIMFNKAQINVQDLAPGSYFLRVTAGSHPYNYMVIIK